MPHPTSTTAAQEALILRHGKAGLGSKKIAALGLKQLKGVKYQVIYRVLYNNGVFNKRHSEEVANGFLSSAKKRDIRKFLLGEGRNMTDTEVAKLFNVKRGDSVSRIRKQITDPVVAFTDYTVVQEICRKKSLKKAKDARRAELFRFMLWKKAAMKKRKSRQPTHRCYLCKRDWYATTDFFYAKKGKIYGWCKICERKANALQYQGLAGKEKLAAVLNTEVLAPKASVQKLSAQFAYDHQHKGPLVKCAGACGKLWWKNEKYFHSVTREGITVVLDYCLACGIK